MNTFTHDAIKVTVKDSAPKSTALHAIETKENNEHEYACVCILH